MTDSTHTYRSAMQVDVPTPNHKIVISKIMMEAAMELYLARANYMGMLEDESDQDNFDLDINKVSHMVNNVYIDSEGYVCANLYFLDTPAGREAEARADFLKLTPILFIVPDWDDSSIITDMEIRHMNLRPDHL